MSVSGEAALAAARRLLRTFASAPDPRRQARMIHSELASAEGWTKAEQKEVDALGAWLQGLPSIGDLKPGCAQVLSNLGRA
jgi:hypothetical protein